MYRRSAVVVDSDPKCHLELESSLKNEGFSFVPSMSAQSALSALSVHTPDIIIMEYELPDSTGPDLCLEIRKKLDVPIIFLSSRCDEHDVVVALSSGGDDFIRKPFGQKELIARIRAVLRRYNPPKPFDSFIPETLSAKDLMIDTSSREVFVNGKIISLTSTEYDILSLLIRNPKQILSNEQIYKLVWDSDFYSADLKTVAVHISSLRKKIDHKNIGYIKTVRGIGYKFNHNLIEDQASS